MTVKQLIDKLQRNFAPEQTVYVCERTGKITQIAHVAEDPIGVTRDGKRLLGLGPDACVIYTRK